MDDEKAVTKTYEDLFYQRLAQLRQSKGVSQREISLYMGQKTLCPTNSYPAKRLYKLIIIF
ncbi:hypothetical protein GCM10023142_32100 [Anaerocolumna aminovalerica]